MAVSVRFSIRQDSTAASWRPMAWDGADLPAAQTGLRPAEARLDVGQTADFLFEPSGPGVYRLG
jgi:hypothetical protein